ncbi:MAG TPA: pilus assembly protein PilN [Vibrio sp.]|nr:pilus assembly protein PilN [Vibrio sp.]
MLHRINLLPWREQQRAAHKQRFISLTFACLILSLLVQSGVGFYIEQQQRIQQQRLDLLQTHVAKLDFTMQKLEKVAQDHQALFVRLKVVEELQAQRNKTTELMNLLPRLIPEGVYIDKLKMSGQQVEMSGISDTTSRLATMLERLENSVQLQDVTMHSIVHDKTRFAKKFQTFSVSFNFLLVKESSKGDGNG